MDIIEAIQSELCHLETMLTFAKDLRKRNILKLHKTQRFRDLLFSDRSLMETHFDELSQLMVPKQVLCNGCVLKSGL